MNKIFILRILLAYLSMAPAYSTEGQDLSFAKATIPFTQEGDILSKKNTAQYTEEKGKAPFYNAGQNMLAIPAFSEATDEDFTDLVKRIGSSAIDDLEEFIAPLNCLGDQSLHLLERASRLKVLDVRVNRRISDRGIERIAHLTEIEKLFLSDTDITDESVPYIVKFKKLTELSILGTVLTKKAIKEIMEAIPALEKEGAFIYNPFFCSL